MQDSAVITQASDAIVTVPGTGDVAATVVTSGGAALTPNAFIVTIADQQINLISVLIVSIILGLILMFWRIQASKKLDFTDILTFDGRKVSLTKTMQLIGGLAATWVVIKMGAVGTLSGEVFGLYLLFIGAIEGYAKYVSAKYGYTETSVRDGGSSHNENHEKITSGASAQDILQAAASSATDAEMSARDAKVSVKNASVDLKTRKARAK